MKFYYKTRPAVVLSHPVKTHAPPTVMKPKPIPGKTRKIDTSNKIHIHTDLQRKKLLKNYVNEGVMNKIYNYH